MPQKEDLKLRKTQSIVWKSMALAMVFVIIIFIVLATFQTMNQKIKSLNEQTIEEIGFTYLSGRSIEIINHSKTYFDSKFESLNQMLDVALEDHKTPQETKSYLEWEISQGVEYVALMKSDATREVLRGDETIHPFDMESYQHVLEQKQNKVMLTMNADGDRMIELVMFRDFEIDGQTYSALLCDIEPDTLNNVLSLFYGEDTIYSFIIREKDGDFVVRNEDTKNQSYYDRIRELYQAYEGMQPEDYVQDLQRIMENGEEYQNVFMINNERRMLYARYVSYTDWYLVTFMNYSEMESLIEANNQKRTLVFNKSFAVLLIVFLVVLVGLFFFFYLELKEQQRLKLRAIKANQSKSDFLSNMSHDIRTPMNVVVGLTDIARDRIDDKEKVQECLEKIARSSRHLLSLINDVLDMSKLESGKMTLSLVHVSLRESMQNIVAIIQPQIKSKCQNFDIYIKNIIEENVYCDSLRLNQVLINLLSNAVKYTPREGTVKLIFSQESSPSGDDYIRNHIIVKDNGIGMSEEFLKIIFDSFAREDMQRVTKEEGTGLGLAITKHIIDIMGGTIEVKSEPDKGSEFHVILDLQKYIENPAQENAFENLRVLVIDDDEELCTSAMDSLQELKANAQYVTSGEDAIEKIKEHPSEFDVILVDWQMPSMNGVETARSIRKYTGDKIPIILISAYDWGDVEDEAKDAGIAGVICKPLVKSTLSSGIKCYRNPTMKPVETKKQEVKFHGEKIL
ncbi:MAG: response regulator, partial [Oscillospiraceae bacterium]|nr:response regulator [Oscillospiraceae bacterium]